jgi:hypothetical protein
VQSLGALAIVFGRALRRSVAERLLLPERVFLLHIPAVPADGSKSIRGML